MYCTTLYCTEAMYFTTLCCTAVYFAAYCTALHWTEVQPGYVSLRSIQRSKVASELSAPCCCTVHSIQMQCFGRCIALYCAALHWASLHCTVLHCNSLHCTALYVWLWKLNNPKNFYQNIKKKKNYGLDSELQNVRHLGTLCLGFSTLPLLSGA